MSSHENNAVEMASISTTLNSAGLSCHSSSTANFPDEPELTEKEIGEKPWKYIGYKGYSEFISSENDFYILRSFRSLNTRIALALQDEITALEHQIDKLDTRYSRRDADDIHNGSFRCDRDDRTELVELIASKLSLYSSVSHLKIISVPKLFSDTFIIQQSELRKYPQAYRQDLTSVRNWHHNHDNRVIADEESDYLNHDQDLISIVAKEKTPLRRFLERSRKFRIFRLWHHHPRAELPVYDKDMITYTSDKRIDKFISTLIVAVGSVMLIAPMWILNSLQNTVYKLAVITAFIFVLLGLLSSTTLAKPFETLAAVAAYSAVLMVFLQLGVTGPSDIT
ncbi:hypothetical protein VE03_06580 [Pseudogymnoascus sp. 23342-1-I1]|nr:hypothetical protein VE03_06580 [Pseudogymnoascus sp. 23342-1-I1]